MFWDDYDRRNPITRERALEVWVGTADVSPRKKFLHISMLGINMILKKNTKMKMTREVKASSLSNT